jgi:hypothetical protein
MFDVVPPGMQETIRRPTAMGSGRSSVIAMTKPMKGMNPYCDTTPIIRP